MIPVKSMIPVSKYAGNRMLFAEATGTVTVLNVEAELLRPRPSRAFEALASASARRIPIGPPTK
jgi:hypothetical protein